MAGFRRHIFVCQNERDPTHPKGCCRHRGSEEILKIMKLGAAKAGLKDVRINQSGCLDHCEYGPTIVIYPEAVWYRIASADDAREVMQKHVIGGEVVERLRIDNIAAAQETTRSS